MSFKITFIGAGSIGFTRKLLQDILGVEAFRGIRIAFTDISEANLQMVTQLCQRDIEANGLAIRIESTLDRREAIRDARYVFNVVRVGGLEAFAHDIDIPLKYGVDQPADRIALVAGSTDIMSLLPYQDMITYRIPAATEQR